MTAMTRTTRTNRAPWLGLLLATAALIAAGGCAADEPVVLNPWPAAAAERTVPKPPEPPRWPLPGMPAASAEEVSRRVASVKIENTAASRPQTNLQAADVVYETVTEGGITRFNAMFHSQTPDTVGPVRSARMSDTVIVPQYKALFAFSGSSPTVAPMIRAAGIDDLSEDAGVTKPFSRSSARPRPHNLYLDVTEMRAEAERRGMTLAGAPPAFDFERVSADTTPTITGVTIPFSNAQVSSWDYDPVRQTYGRSDNGKVSKDLATGEQITARNVVVLWARYSAVSRDGVGNNTYRIELVGSGRAAVFRNGQRFDCTWEASADAPPVFTAQDGTRVKLAPGNTWFQVVDASVNITMR